MKRIKNSLILVLAGVFLVLSVSACLMAFFGTEPHPAFVPPQFDSAAAEGTPNVPEGLGWSELYRQGMTFRASVCGEIFIVGRTATVYFTSPKDNTLWLKLRILSENGAILGETGLIKPGQYIPSITFDTLPENGEKIILKLMSYQPETYYSGGAVTMTTVAKITGD